MVCFGMFQIYLLKPVGLSHQPTTNQFSMKYLSYLLLASFALLLSCSLIQAGSGSDSDKSTVSERHTKRVDRRHGLWSDIKNWFKTGAQRRKSRRLNRRLRRHDRQENRQERRHHRYDNRQERRED